MPSEEIVISAKNLTKAYRLFGHPGDRIKQFLSLGLRQYHREFTALQDVSFDIRRGETIGIIGRNGSGKSTLLQLICGILKPTSGSVTVNGRVSALLELGAGFNPEFTGRENVYFQGALTGLTDTTIGERFDDIAAFADIGNFIDQPVRTYSSGMFLRLAFAVASHVDPDVLIIDEALAVGDARFQLKCFRRFEKLKDNGVTIIVVSHATEQIMRLCSTVLMLDCGRLKAHGAPNHVIGKYLDNLFDEISDTGTGRLHAMHSDGAMPFSKDDKFEVFHTRPAYNTNEYRWGNRNAAILDFMLFSDGTPVAKSISHMQTLFSVCVKVRFAKDVVNPVYGLILKSKEGFILMAVNTQGQDKPGRKSKANEIVFVEFSLNVHLGPDDYFISVGVSEDVGNEIVPLDRRYDSIHIRITGQANYTGPINLSPAIDILCEEDIKRRLERAGK